MTFALGLKTFRKRLVLPSVLFFTIIKCVCNKQVVLEKRLGIAQLCLLLAVLVFMGLTRGSRTEIEHGPVRLNSLSMKEWGKRHFSNDWIKGKTSIFKGGSSTRSEERSRSRDFTSSVEPLSSKLHPTQKSSHAEGCTFITCDNFRLVIYFFPIFFSR